MPEEKQVGGPDDGIADEMPDAGGPPCGDIFGTPEAIYVTDADAVDEDQDG